MDDVLQRMLEVERQAGALVQDAERQAAAMVRTAQEQAAALADRAKTEAAAAAAERVAAEIKAAEEKRREALARGETLLSETERQLRTRSAAAVDAVAPLLTEPVSAQPGNRDGRRPEPEQHGEHG